ncbi:MAG: matrixin family metalloprotease [Candidatus Paceibacterota bacterium]|jgi:predicted Zn-dependent protease
MRIISLVIKIFTALVVVSVGLYFVGEYWGVLPCEEPLAYKIENFDERFDVSEEYFVSALQDAEAIWEKPLDRDLFVYTPESKRPNVIKVNFIYDFRQATTSKLEVLDTKVEKTQASYDALKLKFESSKRAYEAAASSLNARVESFNEKKGSHEANVKYWNDKGGAPPREYKELEAERLSLEAEAAMLEREQEKVNQMADQVNFLVGELNAVAEALNLSVNHYNTVNGSRGETFEEGVYVSDGLKQEINIYEFSTRAELVRVLAHEFGHALTLEHVSDPNALMYELNESDNKELTAADIEEFESKCGAYEPE